MGVKSLSGRKQELERPCQGGCKCHFSTSSQTHLGFSIPHPTITILSLQLFLILCLLALESHTVTEVPPWCTLLCVSLWQSPQPPLPGVGNVTKLTLNMEPSWLPEEAYLC